CSLTPITTIELYLSSSIYSLSPPFFFFNDTPTTDIYTLSLHDALPISSHTAARQIPCETCGEYEERHHEHARQRRRRPVARVHRSEEHTSELQSRENLVCRLLLEKKKKKKKTKKKNKDLMTKKKTEQKHDKKDS